MFLRKTQAESKAEKEAKKPTIKKPLNAFMLYMKEMRAKVIAECTLKESAAINQILGRRVRPQAGGLAGVIQPADSLTHPICPSFPFAVARTVTGRTGQVLRTGPQGEAAAHAAIPRLVSAGQLREWPTTHSRDG